jgi:hypothetical protein
MGDASHVAAILLLFGAATADAQIAPPPNAAGAYQKLSPGNQKVARALFEAQSTPTTTTTTKGARKTTTPSPSAAPSAAGSANGPKPLTLDQIAAMKQSGTGWEQVFRQMRAHGLVTDKNIGQVVTRYNQSSRPPSASVVTTGSEAGRGSGTLAGNAARSNDGASAHGNGDAYGRSGNLR